MQYLNVLHHLLFYKNNEIELIISQTIKLYKKLINYEILGKKPIFLIPGF